jgi:hypothetical protein
MGEGTQNRLYSYRLYPTRRQVHALTAQLAAGGGSMTPPRLIASWADVFPILTAPLTTVRPLAGAGADNREGPSVPAIGSRSSLSADSGESGKDAGGQCRDHLPSHGRGNAGAASPNLATPGAEAPGSDQPGRRPAAERKHQ